MRGVHWQFRPLGPRCWPTTCTCRADRSGSARPALGFVHSRDIMRRRRKQGSTSGRGVVAVAPCSWAIAQVGSTAAGYLSDLAVCHLGHRSNADGNDRYWCATHSTIENESAADSFNALDRLLSGSQSVGRGSSLRESHSNARCRSSKRRLRTPPCGTHTLVAVGTTYGVPPTWRSWRSDWPGDTKLVYETRSRRA
jgi:hypothetical protein